MKQIRLAVLCSLLILSAVPAFAIGCESCTGDYYPYCEPSPGSKTRCEIGVDYCFDRNAPFCSDARSAEAAPAVLAEWTVASIEITRPAETTKLVTSPAAVAELSQPRQ